jgi:hypothetical protein
VRRESAALIIRELSFLEFGHPTMPTGISEATKHAENSIYR